MQSGLINLFADITEISVHAYNMLRRRSYGESIPVLLYNCGITDPWAGIFARIIAQPLDDELSTLMSNNR
jgi:hypothetical protein